MAKDDMAPEQAQGNTADADDEVIDLLEVVKPGKKLDNTSSEDEDFSADLEAMLDSLSDAQTALDEKEKVDVVQPFPDPTPVDHKVDHDESLDLPAMDDIDDILKSLGADSATTAGDNDDSPSGAPASAMPDLDALPAAAAAQSPAPAPNGNKNAADDDLLESLLAGTGEADTPAAPAEEAFDEPALDEDAVASMMAEFGLGTETAGQEKEDPVPGKTAAELEDDLLSGTANDLPPPVPDEGFAAQPSDAAAKPALDDDLLAELGIQIDAPAEPVITFSESAEPPVSTPDQTDEPAETGEAIQAAPEPQEPVSPVFEEEGSPEGPGEEPALPPPPTVLLAVKKTVANSDAQERAPEEKAPADQPAAAPAAEDAPGGDHPVEATAPTPPAEEETVTIAATDMPEQEQATAPEAAPQEQAAPPRYDEVDLNELDALLDDVLASAPASGPTPVTAPAPTPEADVPQVAEAAPPQEAPAGATADAHEARLTDLEEALSGIRSDVDELGKETREAVAELQAAAAESTPAHEARFTGLEETLSGIRSDLEEFSKETREAMAGLQAAPADTGENAVDEVREMLDGHATTLSTYAARLEDAELTLTALDTRIDDLEKQLADMQANLDKLAAEAAARVIREELAALLQAEAE